MARPQEEPRYGELPPRWSFRDQPESATPTSPYQQQPPPQPPHNLYAGETFPCSYTAPGVLGADVTSDERYVDAARMSGFQNYALLDVSNGRLVGKVLYDENRQRRFVIPVDGQYELFERAPPPRDISQPPAVPSNVFSVPPDFSGAPAPPEYAPRAHHHLGFPCRPDGGVTGAAPGASVPTSNFLKDVLGNWEPNVSGTYSPFGQHYPLNHPSANAPEVSREGNNATDEAKLVSNQKNVCPPRRADPGPLADTGRKRIVAEVKPMRPSYSDVLAKNSKTPPIPEPTKKSKTQVGGDIKSLNVKNGTSKGPPPSAKPPDESKPKAEKAKAGVRSPASSGSDSGDVNTDDNDKPTATAGVKRKSKGGKMSRAWSSLHNITGDDAAAYDSNSDFVFIQNPPEKTQRKGKKEKGKSEKSVDTEEEASLDNAEEDGFLLQESHTEASKAKKKAKERSYGGGRASKAAEKKKSVTKSKRGKPGGYVGVAQAYVERWSTASLKALVWFWYLLSDICHMSAHLTFDLLTSVFTQTYVSSQAVWRSGKDHLAKLRDSKYLQYIDEKLGATPLGFWRNMKWFKKVKEQPEANDGSKVNTNIPLPATGEEAMKRLLACKGKDPYSILGVTVSCSDEEIKRYYRRQAFLVHPDKNQQPGAEEAFKILQHAFDLIGEPERREAFDRRTLEHQHVEAAWSELSTLLAQLHDKMEVAANTIRCTNCGRRHKRVITDRPCYAARYCSQCKIRHSAKEGDIWAESGMWGLLVMYYACMDGAVYQITQWASCQKKNLRQLKPNCHVVQYRIVLGNKAGAAPNLNQRPSTGGSDPNLEEFLNNLYGPNRATSPPAPPPASDPLDPKARRRNKKTKT